MSIARQLVKKLIERSGLEVHRRSGGLFGVAREPEWKLHNGPWAPGYDTAKARLIATTLADPTLLTCFRVGGELPDDHGIGIDERCVEYPWALSRLHPSAERILDAGSVLNHEMLVVSPVLRDKTLHILTLAPERRCFWSRGISYVFGNLVDIPMRDNYYDAIVCLSTLEHVGFDNFGYTGKHESARPDEFLLAMKEFRRVLKPGGVLLLSVPFGARQDFEAFQQFDIGLVSAAINAFGPAREIVQRFYRYSDRGWTLSTAVDCAESRYVDWVGEVWGGKPWPEPKHVEGDFAAAARAVACIELVKG
jgi:SAM-dependent methyltransferase